MTRRPPSSPVNAPRPGGSTMRPRRPSTRRPAQPPSGGVPMSDHRHLIGLLLGTEEDWPTAFEAMIRRLGPVVAGSDRQHHYDVERITIEPFELCARPRHD